MIGTNLALPVLKRAMFCIVLLLAGAVAGTAAEGDNFVWFLDKANSNSLAVRGNTPNDMLMAYLATNAGVTISDKTSVASGAPKGFAAAALASMYALEKLDDGRVYFDGKEWTLAGHAASQDIRTAAVSALVIYGQELKNWNIIISAPERATGSIEVAQNPVEVIIEEDAKNDVITKEYNWFLTKDINELFDVSGLSPTAGFTAFLASNAGVEINDSSTPTKGAPKGFSTAALAGITALSNLEFGRVFYEGREWTLSGHALSPDDRATAENTLTTYGQQLRDWNIIISAPEAENQDMSAGMAEADPAESTVVEEEMSPEPYVWRIAKNDGALSVNGQSPNEKFVPFLANNAGETIDDHSVVRVGAPKGFSTGALAGITALGNLENGWADFNGTEWTLTGHAATPEDRENAENALVTVGQDLADWNIIITATAPEPEPEVEPEPEIVTEPTPEPEMALPTQSPYLWRAEKSDNGIRALSGYAPGKSLQQELADTLGGGSNDRTELANGAPAGFEIDAFAALWALGGLDSGAVGFDGDNWAVSGRAPNIKTLQRTQIFIDTNALNSSAWTIEVDISVAQCAAAISQIMAETTIIFGSGSARITTESLQTLDRVAAVMTACPRSAITVEGHTDSYGPDNENMDLSVRRALVVSDYLIGQQVATDRMTVAGYGESLPIATNDTRAGRAQNRRIVFQIQNQTE